MKFNVETGEFAEYMVEKAAELKSAKAFKFYPCKPITIKEVDIRMKDEYSGSIDILLSNDHTVEYRCIEVRGECGPDCTFEVSVARPGECGYRIYSGKEFGEEYLANYGDFIPAIMACYSEYHRK